MHAPSLVRVSVCSTYRPLLALTALLFLYDLALVKQKDVPRAHKMRNMLMRRGNQGFSPSGSIIFIMSYFFSNSSSKVLN